jgi:hypothetical protein
MREELVGLFFERASTLFAFLEDEYGFRRRESLVKGHGAHAIVQYDGPNAAVQIRLDQGVGVTLERKRTLVDRLLGRGRFVEDRARPLEEILELASHPHSQHRLREEELERELEQFAAALHRGAQHLLSGERDLEDVRR